MAKHLFTFILLPFFFYAPAYAEKNSSIGPSYKLSSSWKKSSTWKGVAKLVDEQKYAAAEKATREILKEAIEEKDDRNWTIALIMKQNMMNAQHKVESSLADFRKSKWPKSMSSRLLLSLYYAQSLNRYYQYYSYEINQREKVVTDKELDLKKWTKDDLFNEIQKTLVSIWESRKKLKNEKTGEFTEFIREGSYPRDIRGTIRDAFTYFYVSFLENSNFWAAEQVNGKKLLSLDELINIKKKYQTKEDLLNPKLHPLFKMHALLSELERWHWNEDREGAMLEARFARYRLLKKEVTDKNVLKKIENHLSLFIRDHEGHPWWSEGKFLLAQIRSSRKHGTALIEARKIAIEGRDKHPKSIGARRCDGFIKNLERPELKMNSVNFDRPERKSLQLKYKNWSKLFLRAYKVDPVTYLLGSKDYDYLPRRNKMPKLIEDLKEHKVWNVEFKDPKDYRQHTKFIQVPIKENGYYIIQASAKEDFSTNTNILTYVYLNISDYHISLDKQVDATYLRVFDAENGKKISKAQVTFYQLDWKNKHKKDKEMETNKDGEIILNDGALNERYSYVFTVKKDQKIFHYWDRIYPNQHKNVAREYEKYLGFLDRSIYRPHQKLYFKIQAYLNRAQKKKLPTPLVKKELKAVIRDTNHKIVKSLDLKTNDFGTAAGEFDIPAGRVLGRWTLEINNQFVKGFKVEEYKRPTFLTEMKKPKKAVRLNEMAEFSGHARYYYGLPVTEGSVKWKVYRQISYPYWYYWRFGITGDNSRQMISSGETKLNKEGGYKISFLPKAPTDKSSKHLKYRYSVEVEVLNQGGEIAKTKKVFTIGHFAAVASILPRKSYFMSHQKVKIDFLKQDLNGGALAGKGKVKLFKLKNPTNAVYPYDYPALLYKNDENKEGPFFITDDHMRFRNNGTIAQEQILKSWDTEKQINTKNLVHNEKGKASVDYKKLKPGAYRLEYESRDAFGKTIREERDFLVFTKKSNLKLPVLLFASHNQALVGERIHYIVHTGITGQRVYFELYSKEKKIKTVTIGPKSQTYSFYYKVKKSDRGGLRARIYTVMDNYLVHRTVTTSVPYLDRELDINVSRIRDRIYPGKKETWKLKVKQKNFKGKLLPLKSQVELLAYMYDKSLDVFMPHSVESIGALPQNGFYSYMSDGRRNQSAYQLNHGLHTFYSIFDLYMDRIYVYDSYGVGGMGMRGGLGRSRGIYEDSVMEVSSFAGKKSEMPATAKRKAKKGLLAVKTAVKQDRAEEEKEKDVAVSSNNGDVEMRSNFTETAFFKPQLLTNKKGEVELSFTVPDSLTEWNFWTTAVTKDLLFGNKWKKVQSVKDLMVRTYLPRFLRQGDNISLKVVIDNAGKKSISGTFYFELWQDEEKVTKEFSLDEKFVKGMKFKIAAGKSKDYSIPVRVPNDLGDIKIKAYAKSQNFTDGEEKRLPILPSRIHLAQSHFVSLENQEKREMSFADMLVEDKTRINDSLVVKIDGQLFYSVLSALPYLVNYPYECTEQTLNRFLVSGMLNQTYKKFPSIAKMAKKMSSRKTQYESFDQIDPNRKMSLAETPWLQMAEGGSSENLLNMLDDEVVKKQKRDAINKLKKAQTSIGGFPWFSGGPPSYYMTTYILHGLAKAQEFGVEIPKDMNVKGWKYIKSEYKKTIKHCMKHKACYEMITYVNFTLSSYKDQSYTGNAFSKSERKEMLDYSFSFWKKHSPQLKGMLSLLLKRMGRKDDAKLVFDSILDTAKTQKDLGTYWAPEDRSWLWYNDTIETQAYALRAMLELQPNNKLRHGLVKWLFLNKKLNHWKSTKATAEVMYSVLHYLQQEGTLDIEQKLTVSMGSIARGFEFKPEEYTGKNNFVAVKGKDIDEKSMNKITVEQTTKGMAFASATWHYSTQELSKEARGDFFEIKRRYFKREVKDKQMVLVPLKEGSQIKVGDQVEVHISIKSKHKAQYVHLRDPRPAGFEPERSTSGYKWDLGLIRFEEVRDSGMNFFMESIPVGEYTLKHQIRANLAGEFRVAPAKIESVYAPEFKAFSSGILLEVQ